MLFEYTGVLILLALAIANIVLMLVIPKVLRPDKPSPEKLVAYECGENPVGTGWLQYNVRFFTIALVFVVFDVEIVFMYPWAVTFRELFKTQGTLPFWEMFVFVAILAVGLAYLWLQGLLDWVKSINEA